jgi:hypothetical protein
VKAVEFGAVGFVTGTLGAALAHGLSSLRRSRPSKKQILPQVANFFFRSLAAIMEQLLLRNEHKRPNTVGAGHVTGTDCNDQVPKMGVAWLLFMAINSNLRFHMLAAGQDVLLSASRGVGFNIAPWVLRLGNDVVGAWTWVETARMLGLEQVR